MGPGPGGDQCQVCGGAGDGGPARHHQERRQGDRVWSGQGHHLHGQVGLRHGRQLLPRPPVVVVQGRQVAALLRQGGRPRHVGDDEAVPRRPTGARPRDHLFPGALHQFLQALHGGHLRADARRLELRQPHGGLSGVRRRYQGHPRRVPHRRRRPQSLPRLRGTDRRGSRRRGEEDEARARLLGRRLRSVEEAPRDPQDPAGSDGAARRVQVPARGDGRRRDRPLRTHGRMGAVRVRPAHHRSRSSSAASSATEGYVMAETIKCISPVDGRVYASRRVASEEGDHRRVRGGARGAGAVETAADRRAGRVLLGGGRCDDRHDGRDRAGAGVADGPAGALWRRRAARVRGARPLHDRDRRGGAVGPRSGSEGGLRALREARPARRRLHDRAVELSLSHGRQLDHSRR